MAYTKHGHHIKGTQMEVPFIGLRAKCGGPAFCEACKRDAGFAHHPSNTNLRKKDA